MLEGYRYELKCEINAHGIGSPHKYEYEENMMVVLYQLKLEYACSRAGQ